MSIYQYFRDVVDEKGAGYFVLIDPDRLAREAILDLAEKASAGGADALFVGSSLFVFTDAKADSTGDQSADARM